MLDELVEFDRVEVELRELDEVNLCQLDVEVDEWVFDNGVLDVVELVEYL